MSKKIGEGMNAKKSKINILFIGPYGKDEIEQRHRDNIVYILEKVFSNLNKSEMDYNFETFYQGHTGTIDQLIYKKIVKYDLLIGDLRGLNPNVMYEVGLRHAFNSPILLLKDVKTELPFNISTSFYIDYPLPIEASQIMDLVSEVQQTIPNVLNSKEPFSSFYQSTQIMQNLEAIGSSQVNVEQIISRLLDQVGNLNSKSLTDTEAQVLSLRKEGYTQQEIASILNKHQPQISKVYNILREKGYSI